MCFVAVLMAALDIIPAFDPTVVPRPPVLQSPLFTLHVVSLLFAYASFALACVLGVIYVLLFKEIKAKHLGFFYARLPSLQVLDVMNGRVLSVGWIFLTVGLVVGGIWATQVAASPDPRVQAMSVADPEDPRRDPVVGRLLVRRSSRDGRSAGAAGGRHGCRRWPSRSCC